MSQNPPSNKLANALGGIGLALSSKNFAWYCGGMALSLTGSFVFFTALGWVTFELTRSPAWLGTVVLAETLPNVIVGPFAGVLIDRWSAKWALFWAQLFAAIIMTLLSIATFGGWITIELLIVFAILIGTLNGVAFPAHFAILPKLVPRENLSPAVALQTSVSQTARFLGPAAAGGLIILGGGDVWGGGGLAFGFKAVSYSGFLIALLFIHVDETKDTLTTRGSVGRELLDGMQYAWSTLRLRYLLITAVALGIFLRPVYELMPAFVGGILNSDATALSTLLAATGGGAMIASLWLARRGKLEGLVNIQNLTFAVTALVLGIFLFTRNIGFGIFLMVLYGTMSASVLIANQTLLQSTIDDRMRARVLSLYALTLRAIPALGAFIVGHIAGFTGLVPALAGVTVLGVLYWLWVTFSPSAKEHHNSLESDP
jgi:MFS family permease